MTRSDVGVTPIWQGIVLWPHWSTSGDGNYDLSIEVLESAEESA